MQLMSLRCPQTPTAAQTSHGVAQAALCRERWILGRRWQSKILGSWQTLTDIDRLALPWLRNAIDSLHTGPQVSCTSQEGRNPLEGALEDIHDTAREEGGEGTTERNRGIHGFERKGNSSRNQESRCIERPYRNLKTFEISLHLAIHMDLIRKCFSAFCSQFLFIFVHYILQKFSIHFSQKWVPQEGSRFVSRHCARFRDAQLVT